MGNFKKRGLVKITNGKYTDRDGKEKTRYVIVGEYFATDHNNRQAIKLNATAFSEEKWLNIYLDQEEITKSSDLDMPNEFDNDIKVIEEIGKVKQDVILEDIDDKPIDLSVIPF